MNLGKLDLEDIDSRSIAEQKWDTYRHASPENCGPIRPAINSHFGVVFGSMMQSSNLRSVVSFHGPGIAS